MNRWLVSIGIVCGLSFAASADDSCEPQLGLMLPVFLNLSNPTTPTFTVNRGERETCKYFVAFSRGNSSNYDRFMQSGSNQYQYNIYKDSSLQTILKDVPDANRNEVVDGLFSSGLNDNTNNHQFTVFRPNQSIKPSGLYLDTVRVSLYEGRVDQSHDLRDTKTLLVFYFVPQEVQLSLVDSGAPFNAQDVNQNLDFGTLQTGASLGFDLMVQSNSGYSLTMSSQNNGALKHLQNSSQTVPYTLSVGGQSKDLSSSHASPVVVASGSGSTPQGGNRHSVSVVIGSIQNKMSGQYQDNITVTVTAD